MEKSIIFEETKKIRIITLNRERVLKARKKSKGLKNYDNFKKIKKDQLLMIIRFEICEEIKKNK